MNNHTCKVCGYHYHHCSTCDCNGIPWEPDGFCCGECYYSWSQAEIERLQGVVNRLQLTLQNINVNTEGAGFLNLDQARWKLGMGHRYSSCEDDGAAGEEQA